ncbi:hypothetical protein [Granulicella arctica]|uniref:hypothetical protein n=1 Tax=Granulicella arctica TaxID=940613 RepID=UPI0021E08ACD|nr:hypothetical protein [Granulicella arctica]
MKLEKRGDFFYTFVSGKDGKLSMPRASTKLVLKEPFYVGIRVSAHDEKAVEKAVFANVKLEKVPLSTGSPVLYSALETVNVLPLIAMSNTLCPTHIEAPN